MQKPYSRPRRSTFRPQKLGVLAVVTTAYLAVLVRELNAVQQTAGWPFVNAGRLAAENRNVASR